MAIQLGSQVEPIPGYKLLERLGIGGFGEVWKAEAPGGIPKAIKFIHGSLNEEGSQKQATQELRSLHRVKDIHHPFLLQLERVDIIDGQLIIVIELADRDLMMRFKESQLAGLPGIPREELLRYMEETAEVLDLMNQEHGLQHLDIKPQNLFLVRNHIKVADFGMVKDLQGMTGTVTGGITPLYAAPETFDNRLSRTSDQYSLAIVYQEVLTGVRPFNGANAMQLLMQHCSQPPDLTALPAGDRAAVGRALAKNHADRFSSCAEFIKALRRAPAGGLAKPGRVPPVPLDSTTPASVPQMHKDTTSELLPPKTEPYKKVAATRKDEPPSFEEPPATEPYKKVAAVRQEMAPAVPEPIKKAVPASRPEAPPAPTASTPGRQALAKQSSKDSADPSVFLPPPFDPDKSPRLNRSGRRKSRPQPANSDDTTRSKSATVRIKKSAQETKEGEGEPALEAACPRCGHALFDPDNLGWCARCGYCDAIESHRAAPASQVREFIDALPGWAWVLTGGIFAAGGLTFAADQLLPPDSKARVTWAIAQFALGVAGFLAAHLWGFLLLPREDKFVGHIYSQSFRNLPETRGPVWVGGWSLALLAGSILLGLLGCLLKR